MLFDKYTASKDKYR